MIRNYNEFKRLRRVNTREICPRVGQVSIQVMKRKRNAAEDGLKFLESERSEMQEPEAVEEEVE